MMKLPVFLIWTIVLLWWAGDKIVLANSPVPRLNTILDTTQFTIGSPITLTLAVTCPREAAVVWPSLQDGWKELEVWQRKIFKTAGPGELVQQRFKITFTSLTAGTQIIPSLPVQVFTPQDTFLFSSHPVAITCHLLPADPARPFKEIHPSVPIDFTPAELRPYQLGAGLVTLLLFFLGYRKAFPQWPSFIRRRPAYYRQALRELRNLEKTGDIPTKLPLVLRTYLGARFAMPAVAATTEEILHHLHLEKLAEDQLQPLQTVLQATDEAKYGLSGYQVLDPAAMLENSRQFVQATKPLN